MKIIMGLFALVLQTTQADVSFTYIVRDSKGVMATAFSEDGKDTHGSKRPNAKTKYFYKNDRMRIDINTTHSTIWKFGSPSFMLNHQDKTYFEVTSPKNSDDSQLSELDLKIDVKETGQKKTVNGYSAREVLIRSEFGANKMKMTNHAWYSTDVPGAAEIQAAHNRLAQEYAQNGIGNIGSNPTFVKAMQELQKKTASIQGVSVQQNMKVEMDQASEKNAQILAQQKATQDAINKLIAKGGAYAEQGKKLQAMLGASQNSKGSVFESTMDLAEVSTAPIAASLFELPKDYVKKESPLRREK